DRPAPPRRQALRDRRRHERNPPHADRAGAIREIRLIFDTFLRLCHIYIKLARLGRGAMPGQKKPPGFAEEATDWRQHPSLPDRIDLQLGPGGRIVIPVAFRKAMQIEAGGRLLARVVDGELRIITPEMAILRAQKWVRETIPAGASLVDD